MNNHWVLIVERFISNSTLITKECYGPFSGSTAAFNFLEQQEFKKDKAFFACEVRVLNSPSDYPTTYKATSGPLNYDK